MKTEKFTYRSIPFAVDLVKDEKNRPCEIIIHAKMDGRELSVKSKTTAAYFLCNDRDLLMLLHDSRQFCYDLICKEYEKCVSLPM